MYDIDSIVHGTSTAYQAALQRVHWRVHVWSQREVWAAYLYMPLTQSVDRIPPRAQTSIRSSCCGDLSLWGQVYAVRFCPDPLPLPLSLALCDPTTLPSFFPYRVLQFNEYLSPENGSIHLCLCFSSSHPFLCYLARMERSITVSRCPNRVGKNNHCS